jgi:hypothetical protein
MAAKSGKRDSRGRADGRRPLLVYMQPEMVKDLKKAALDEDRNAYEIVEEAVHRWLAARIARGARNPAKK